MDKIEWNENNKLGLKLRWEQSCSLLKTMGTLEENVRDTCAIDDICALCALCARVLTAAKT